MTDFIAMNANWPFSAALFIMLLLALLEVVGMIMGAGLSDLFDSILPDMDVDVDVDMDSHVETGHSSVLGSLFAWLRIGEIPSVISLVILLLVFGLLGLTLQAALIKITGSAMSPMAASLIVLPASIPLLRLFSGWVARVIPQDETESVSSDTFVGRTATVIIGDAEHNSPAQAKLVDEFGKTHYIMVEPDQDNPMLKQGSDVILLEKMPSTFIATPRD